MMKIYREMKKIADAHDRVLEHGGKHPVMRCRRGERVDYVVSFSPSDHRFQKNVIADLRRIDARGSARPKDSPNVYSPAPGGEERENFEGGVLRHG